MSGRFLRRNESGAVAITVAILALVLFGVAALSVDLGNAWSRKRAVQKQVDISAFAGGALLPMKTTDVDHDAIAISAEVAESLNDEDNQAIGQNDVTGPELLNGNAADGEIYFQNTDGTSCTDNCLQMRVVAPSAHVDFGLAGAIGFSGTDVTRDAVVRIESPLPPRKKIIPFWLPSGCGYGPAEADTTNGGNPHETETPTATPTSTATSTATATSTTPAAPSPSDSSLHLTGTAVLMGYQQSTTVSGWQITGVGGYKKLTLVPFSPDGTPIPGYGVQLPNNGDTVPDFTVGTEVSNTGGVWKVYVLAEKNNGTQAYSEDYLTVTVIGSPSTSATPTPTETATTIAPPPTDCIGPDRGNFGQLVSPRGEFKDSQLQKAFPYNIALGLDHTVVPYVFPDGETVVKTCPEDGEPPGAILDDESGTEGNGANCINGDTGNDGPKIYEGLVSGPDGATPGRLDATNPGVNCTGRIRSDLDVPINDDLLSCFLRDGHSLADLASDSATQAMLDPAVVKSVRFVWLPTVYATDRAEHGFQPLLRYVPGFITDETQVSTKAVSDASSHNGLEVNSNSVKVLTVFVFSPTALPPSETADSTGYDPDIGNPQVRLVG